jgi:hypothetical protein
MLCLASILLSQPYVVCVYGMYAVEVLLSLVLAVRPLPTPTHPSTLTHPPVGLNVSRDPSQLVSVL